MKLNGCPFISLRVLGVTLAAAALQSAAGAIKPLGNVTHTSVRTPVAAMRVIRGGSLTARPMEPPIVWVPATPANRVRSVPPRLTRPPESVLAPAVAAIGPRRWSAAPLPQAFRQWPGNVRIRPPVQTGLPTAVTRDSRVGIARTPAPVAGEETVLNRFVFRHARVEAQTTVGRSSGATLLPNSGR